MTVISDSERLIVCSTSETHKVTMVLILPQGTARWTNKCYTEFKTYVDLELVLRNRARRGGRGGLGKRERGGSETMAMVAGDARGGLQEGAGVGSTRARRRLLSCGINRIVHSSVNEVQTVNRTFCYHTQEFSNLLNIYIYTYLIYIYIYIYKF